MVSLVALARHASVAQASQRELAATKAWCQPSKEGQTSDTETTSRATSPAPTSSTSRSTSPCDAIRRRDDLLKEDVFDIVAAAMPRWLPAPAGVPAPASPAASEPWWLKLEQQAAQPAKLSKLDEELMEAVADSDEKRCRKCLQAGANTALVTSGGKPLIFFALMRAKDAVIVKLLLEAGASVSPVDEAGNGVMHLWARATRARDELLPIGEALIRAGADIDAARSDGMTPLHLLAAGNDTHRGWGDFHKAALLVRNGANTTFVAPCGRAPADMLKQDGRTATNRFMQLLEGCQLCTEDMPRCNQNHCAWCFENQIFRL